MTLREWLDQDFEKAGLAPPRNVRIRQGMPDRYWLTGCASRYLKRVHASVKFDKNGVIWFHSKSLTDQVLDAPLSKDPEAHPAGGSRADYEVRVCILYGHKMTRPERPRPEPEHVPGGNIVIPDGINEELPFN